jgi:hypothetical protein
MAQDMGVVTHPEIHDLIPIHIPDLRTFGIFYKKRIGGEVVNTVRNASWHNLSGPFEKGF